MCMIQYGYCSSLPPPHPHPTDPDSVSALETWGDFKDWGDARKEDLPPNRVAIAAGHRRDARVAQEQATVRAIAPCILVLLMQRVGCQPEGCHCVALCAA